MEFEYSDSTKEIREAHKKHFDKYIRVDNVKRNKETAQKLQKKYLERFEFIFSEQFIPLLACFGANEMRQGKNKEKAKEAIYLTLEYIDKILALAPPQGAKEHKIYYEMLHRIMERKIRETEKVLYYPHFVLGDPTKNRKKHLTKKEQQRLCEVMGWGKPIRYEDRSLMNLRIWVNNIMQDNLNCLFNIWERQWEQQIIIKPFIEGVSSSILERIKEPKNPNRCDKRIYPYIVQYLKYIAQKEIKARKLKLQVKECFWSKEWIEDLRHIQFHPLLKPRKTRFPQVEVFNAEIREESIITNKKNYLGNNKEFEKELLRYLKEIKNEYLANNQK